MLNRDKKNINICIIILCIILTISSVIIAINFELLKAIEKTGAIANVDRAKSVGLILPIIIAFISVFKIYDIIKYTKLANKYNNTLQCINKITCTSDIAKLMNTDNKTVDKQLTLLITNQYFEDSWYQSENNSFTVCGGLKVIYIGNKIPVIKDNWSDDSIGMRNWGS